MGRGGRRQFRPTTHPPRSSPALRAGPAEPSAPSSTGCTSTPRRARAVRNPQSQCGGARHPVVVGFSRARRPPIAPAPLARHLSHHPHGGPRIVRRPRAAASVEPMTPACPSRKAGAKARGRGVRFIVSSSWCSTEGAHPRGDAVRARCTARFRHRAGRGRFLSWRPPGRSRGPPRPSPCRDRIRIVTRPCERRRRSRQRTPTRRRASQPPRMGSMSGIGSPGRTWWTGSLALCLDAVAPDQSRFRVLRLLTPHHVRACLSGRAALHALSHSTWSNRPSSR